MQALTSAMPTLATLLEMHGAHSDVHRSMDGMAPFLASFSLGVDSRSLLSLRHAPPLPGYSDPELVRPLAFASP